MDRNWKDRDIDMQEFGGAKAGLKATDIGKANATVITVTDVEKVEVPDPDRDDGKRVSLILQSEEYPDRGFWLNKTGMKTLIEKFGGRPGQWIGEKVPLVKVRVNNPQTGKVQESLQVASPAEWDDVMDAFTGTTRRRAAKKAPAKRGGKR